MLSHDYLKQRLKNLSLSFAEHSEKKIEIDQLSLLSECYVSIAKFKPMTSEIVNPVRGQTDPHKQTRYRLNFSILSLPASGY